MYTMGDMAAVIIIMRAKGKIDSMGSLHHVINIGGVLEALN